MTWNKFPALAEAESPFQLKRNFGGTGDAPAPDRLRKIDLLEPAKAIIQA
jgi:hypothetical protein